MNILVIGAGLIGRERISAIKKISINFSIKFNINVVDTNEKILKKVKDDFNVSTNINLEEELNKNPDWIFICTPHSIASNKESFNYL